MRKVVVILESSRRRDVFHMGGLREVGAMFDVLSAIRRWFHAAATRVEEDGVCRSFSIGIHTAGEDCDHEQVEVRS